MEIISELNELGKRLYSKFKTEIEKMHSYTNYGESIELVYKDFDNYLEAILIKVALADNKFENIEKEFVCELFPDCILSNKNEINLELLSKEVDKKLEIVPKFVELSVIADKKIDSELKTMNPTYSQITYDFLRRLPNYLKYVDGNVVIEEDLTLRDSLKAIVKFYKSKYVTYAPKRKE